MCAFNKKDNKDESLIIIHPPLFRKVVISSNKKYNE